MKVTQYFFGQTPCSHRGNNNSTAYSVLSDTDAIVPRIVVDLMQTGINEDEAHDLVSIHETYLPVPVLVEAALSVFPNFRQGDIMPCLTQDGLTHAMLYDKGQRLKLKTRSQAINFYFAGNNDQRVFLISETGRRMSFPCGDVWKVCLNNTQE